MTRPFRPLTVSDSSGLDTPCLKKLFKTPHHSCQAQGKKDLFHHTYQTTDVWSSYLPWRSLFFKSRLRSFFDVSVSFSSFLSPGLPSVGGAYVSSYSLLSFGSFSLVPSVLMCFLLSTASLATFPFTEDGQRELKERIITTLEAEEDVVSLAYDALYAHVLASPPTEHTELRTMLTTTRHPRAGTSYYLWKNLHPEAILSKERLDLAKEGLYHDFIYKPRQSGVTESFLSYLQEWQTILEPLRDLSCVQKILTFYTLFVEHLKKLTTKEHTRKQRQAYLIEKACLTFEDGSIYRISQERARNLISFNEFQMSKRQNSDGIHAVWGYEGVHYKLQVESTGGRETNRKTESSTEFHPAREAAMGFLSRTLGLEAPLPATLLMIIDNPGLKNLITPHSESIVHLKEEKERAEYIRKHPEFKTEIQEIKEDRYYIQATETLGTQTLKSYLETLRDTQHPLEANTFDRTNFTAWLIFSLLIRPYDGKADNFTLREVNGRLQILGIDNDAVFSSLVKAMNRCVNSKAYLAGEEKREEADQKEIFPHIWTTLYALHPLMEAPLSGEVKRHVRDSSVAPFFTWLYQLFHMRERYRYLTQQANLYPSICEAFGFEFAYPSRVFLTLLDTWTKIQKALKDPNITNGTLLLKRVSPFLGSVYQRLGERLNHDPLAIVDTLYATVFSQEDLVEEKCLHETPDPREDALSLENNLKALWSHASLRDASLETIMRIMISLHSIQGLLSSERNQDLWPALEATWPQGEIWQRSSLPFEILQHPVCTVEIAGFLLTTFMENYALTDDQGTPLFHHMIKGFAFSDVRAFPWDLFQEEMNQPDQEGTTPLDVAVACEVPESFMKELVTRGAVRAHHGDALALFLHGIQGGLPTPAPWIHTLMTTLPQLTWHMMLQDLLPSQGPGRLMYTSDNRQRYVPYDLEATLFDETGGFIRRNHDGTRDVGFLPWIHPLAQEGDGLWIKLFPALSAREEAVRSLVLTYVVQDAFFLPLVPPSLLGHLSTQEESLEGPPSPWAVFDRPEDPQPCVSVLVSQNLGTCTLKAALESDPDILSKLDSESLSWLMVITMLVNPEDGRPDNLVVGPHPHKPGLFVIASIDNDHVFVPPIARKMRDSDGRYHISLQVKSFLYCLEAMKTQALHPQVVTTFLARDPFESLQSWCDGLVTYSAIVNDMFTNEEAHHLKHKQSWLGSSFAKNEVLSLYERWSALQEALQVHPEASYLSLLVAADKALGLRYAMAFHQHPTLHAHERFIRVDGEFMSVVMTADQAFPTTGTLTSPQAILQRTDTLPVSDDFATRLKEGRTYGPQEAFEELETHHRHLLNQLGDLFRAKRPLNQAQFMALEQYFSTHPWSSLPLQGRSLILEDLQAGYPFKRLVLTHCDRLTKNILNTLQTRSLTVLKLAHCTGLTQGLMTRLSQTCEGLQVLDVSHTPLKGIYEERGLFRAPTFFRGAYLHTLTATHCPNLTEVYLETPHLQRLALDGCPLRHVGIPHGGLEKIKIENTKLDLSYKRLSPGALFQMLVVWPYLHSLTELDLRGNQMGPEGAQHLSSLTQLTWLDLEENQMGDADVQHLRELTQLRWLNLGNNQIGPEGAQHLSSLTQLTRLDLNSKWLNLGDNQIGPEGAQHLSSLTQLTRLDLKYNQIGDAGAQHLSRLTNLTELDLWENQIGPEGAMRLSQLTNLTALDLGHTPNLNLNQIGPEGAQYLSPLTNLTTLNLSSSHIHPEGAQYLRHLTKLTRLYLVANQIGPEGAQHLSPLIHITSLDLSFNWIGPEGAQHLSPLIHLTSLDLGWNQIGPEGLQHLSPLTQLTRLNLERNQIGPTGVQHLTCLTNLTQLTRLDLDENQIDDAGVQHLSSLTQLTTLYLGSNQIGPEARKKLKQALSRCYISFQPKIF